MTPLPIRHILFPYDFSEQGRQAVPFVNAFARQFGARLTLFSVAPPGSDDLPALKCRLERAFINEFADVCVERGAVAGWLEAANSFVPFATGH